MVAKPTGWKHVVVICRPGNVGAVAALPVALTLKTHWPDCRVTCVIRATTTEVLQHQSAVDAVVCDPGYVSLVKYFRRQPPTAVFVFSPCFAGLLAAFVAHVPTRIVDGAGMLGWCKGLIPKRLSRSRHSFDGIAISGMLRSLGLPPQLPGRPWIVLAQREKRRAHRRLCRASRPRVLVHPSALIGSLGLLDSRWSLVLAGLEAQASPRQSLSQWVERGVLNLLDKLSLREWISILVECDVFVSADDESLLLADAMGIPTVRLASSSRRRESVPVLPEAVMWQVEVVLRHRLRIVQRADGPYSEVR